MCIKVVVIFLVKFFLLLVPPVLWSSICCSLLLLPTYITWQAATNSGAEAAARSTGLDDWNTIRTVEVFVTVRGVTICGAAIEC